MYGYLPPYSLSLVIFIIYHLSFSSFDVYKKEVLSGNLEWSTAHRSEKFWRENSHRLEEDNHKVLLYVFPTPSYPSSARFIVILY